MVTYEPEELLGTKLRALYQRKKGRDLFDLSVAFERLPQLDPEKVIQCFEVYLAGEGRRVSRAEYEKNLAQKLDDAVFRGDVALLMAQSEATAMTFDVEKAGDWLQETLIQRIPGEPWAG